jgi:hypothetical protein
MELMDYDDGGVASRTTTFEMDCDEDSVRFDPRDRMKIESGYLSQPITQNPWAGVGDSNQNPPYDFPVRSTTRTVSNAPFRSRDSREDREDIDSEDDYETIHSGMDIHDESQVSFSSLIFCCVSADFVDLTPGTLVYSGCPHRRIMRALNMLEPMRIG